MSTTESSSHYHGLEDLPIADLLSFMNEEDHKVAPSVKRSLPQITILVEKAYEKIREGGRLFYIGAGTSGRLGILDASEIPPTYGMPHGRVVGLIAGGEQAIRKSVEKAEDDFEQAWKDLLEHKISDQDVLVGIAASGRTPYVLGGVKKARENGIVTGCITCNTETELARIAEFPVEVIVGPEFVTGSTRMKSGTAQKLVLNMISTSLMIRLGRVQGNKMVDMQLSNSKLLDRGVRMIMEELNVERELARALLEKHGSVRKAIDSQN